MPHCWQASFELVHTQVLARWLQWFLVMRNRGDCHFYLHALRWFQFPHTFQLGRRNKCHQPAAQTPAYKKHLCSQAHATQIKPKCKACWSYYLSESGVYIYTFCSTGIVFFSCCSGGCSLDFDALAVLHYRLNFPSAHNEHA